MGKEDAVFLMKRGNRESRRKGKFPRKWIWDFCDTEITYHCSIGYQPFVSGFNGEDEAPQPDNTPVRPYRILLPHALLVESHRSRTERTKKLKIDGSLRTYIMPSTTSLTSAQLLPPSYLSLDCYRPGARSSPLPVYVRPLHQQRGQGLR